MRANVYMGPDPHCDPSAAGCSGTAFTRISIHAGGMTGGCSAAIGEKEEENMEKALHILRLCMNFFYKMLFRYSELVLLVIVVLVSMQVVLRKFFKTGFFWVEEVSLLLVVWMAFISMAIGVAEDLHISINLFYDMFPKRMRRAIDVVNTLLVAGVGAMLAYYGYLLVQHTRDSTLAATKWPSFILYLMIPVSGVYVVYFALLKLHRLLFRLAPDREDREIAEL